MRIIAIIQARMASTRLPGKVLMDIGGKPMLWHVIKRVMTVPALDPIVIATPDGELSEYARELDRLEKTNGRIKGWWFSGDPGDVLRRYAICATEMAADGICRVTGDCPLLDPKPISDVLYLFQSQMLDYVANDIERTWPDGMGVEVFSIGALRRAQADALTKPQREHVTPFMKNDKRNSRRNLACPDYGLAELKLSVDTQADLDFVRAIDAAGPKDYSLKATLEAISRVQAKNLATGA